jgi:hypothetical protein
MKDAGQRSIKVSHLYSENSAKLCQENVCCARRTFKPKQATTVFFQNFIYSIYDHPGITRPINKNMTIPLYHKPSPILKCDFACRGVAVLHLLS